MRSKATPSLRQLKNHLDKEKILLRSIGKFLCSGRSRSIAKFAKILRLLKMKPTTRKLSMKLSEISTATRLCSLKSLPEFQMNNGSDGE